MQVLRRDTRAAARRKKDKPHPELHEAPIIVNGNEVAKITGPLKEYHVDIWSGNHPFYNGDNRNLVLDEGQVRG
jgi:large subunit ribosomal protein L31